MLGRKFRLHVTLCGVNSYMYVVRCECHTHFLISLLGSFQKRSFQKRSSQVSTYLHPSCPVRIVEDLS